MDNFTFYSPTRFVFGKDAENQAGSLIRQCGGTRVLIHFGSESARRSGLLDHVEASLSEAGLSFVSLGGVRPNPRLSKVREGIELAKKAKALNLDSIHDTDHEMARDEARHGKAFAGLLKRYFGK